MFVNHLVKGLCPLPRTYSYQGLSVTKDWQLPGIVRYQGLPVTRDCPLAENALLRLEGIYNRILFSLTFFFYYKCNRKMLKVTWVLGCSWWTSCKSLSQRDIGCSWWTSCKSLSQRDIGCSWWTSCKSLSQKDIGCSWWTSCKSLSQKDIGCSWWTSCKSLSQKDIGCSWWTSCKSLSQKDIGCVLGISPNMLQVQLAMTRRHTTQYNQSLGDPCMVINYSSNI